MLSGRLSTTWGGALGLASSPSPPSPRPCGPWPWRQSPSTAGTDLYCTTVLYYVLYCTVYRLVWDIFPRGDRLIRVVVGSQPGADTSYSYVWTLNISSCLLSGEGERGEEWGEAGQTVASMLELLAAVGRPSTDTRYCHIWACDGSADCCLVAGTTAWWRGRGGPWSCSASPAPDSWQQLQLRGTRAQLWSTGG